MNNKSGVFITFEGIEGSGKSTQCKLLNNYMTRKGIETVLTSEPGGTPFGREVRHVVLDTISEGITPETELLLYIADRAHHVHTKIRPALTAGTTVICDRYHDSSIAYQHFARGVDKSLMDYLFTHVAGNLTPDITFLVDISLETSFERIEKRAAEDISSVTRFEREKREFHRKVREGFLEIAHCEPSRFVIVDGDQDIQSVFQQIQSVIDQKWSSE